MKIKFKKWSLTLVIAVLIMATLCVSALSYWDFDFDGTGTSGGGSVITNPSFSIEKDDAQNNIIAYRFSVVDSNGDKKGKKYDLYNNSWSHYWSNGSKLKYSDFRAFTRQFSKAELVDTYNGSENGSLSVISEIDGYNYATISSVDDTLTRDVSTVGTWLSKNKYTNSIVMLDKCGVSKTKGNLKSGDKLLIEPVIECMLDGKRVAMTPTELAFFAGNYYENFDKIQTPAQGKPSNLNSYILQKFPNLLNVNTTISGLFSAGPVLSKQTTYRNVITKGYGVNIVSANNIVPEYTVTFKPNGGSFTYGGTNRTTDYEFTVQSGTKITIPSASKNLWAFSHWSKGSDEYSSGDEYTVTSDVVFTAQYNPVKVYFNTNGGTVNGADYFATVDDWVCKKSDGKYFIQSWSTSNGEYVEKNILPNTSFNLTKDGYTFVGWTTTENNVFGEYDNNEAYAPGTMTLPSDYRFTKEGEIWLYAIWAPNSTLLDVNLNSIYTNIPSVPVNKFSINTDYKDVTPLKNIYDGHSYEDSLIKLDGTATKGTHGTIGAQYNTVSPGETYYITLIHNSGGYSGTPYFVADTVDSLGLMGTRTYKNIMLPTATNPVKTSTITIPEGKTSLLYWLWSNNNVEYEDYSCKIFITKDNYVHKLNALNYGCFDDDGNFLNAYDNLKKSITGSSEVYINLPSAINITSNPNANALDMDFGTHPFSYVFESWNTTADKTGTEVTRADYSQNNNILYAQYEPRTIDIIYDTSASDVSLGEDYTLYSYGNYVNQICTNGSNVFGTYFYNDNVTIHTDDDFGLTRAGYNFAGWKTSYSDTLLAVPEADGYSNTSSSINELLGSEYLADTVDSIVLYAQWTPIKYYVQFWTDIGEDEKYVNIIDSSGYGENGTIIVDPWISSIDASADNLSFKNNSFLKVVNDEYKMVLSYDVACNLLKNKFNMDYHKFNGWYAYSESKDAYYVKDNNEGGYWKSAAEQIALESLYLFADEQEIIGLTDVEFDTIRMFGIIRDSDNITENSSWTPNSYDIVYCGNNATGSNYDRNYKDSCHAPGHNGDQYFYFDDTTHYVNIDNIIAFNEKDDKTVNHVFENYVECQTLTLELNKFIKTGYHINDSATWIASCVDGDNIFYYGKNSVGEFGWHDENEIADFYYFKNGHELVNLYIENNDATVYMHSCWENNQYKIYYCGNGANGQRYGEIGVPDANGSVFANNHNSIDCPISSGDGCQYGDYYDQTIWTYDGNEKPLYENKFSRTGYTFVGWRAYDTSSKLWYGYKDDVLGWYSKVRIDSYYTFYDKETVVNMSEKNNGIVYMVAQWTPISYTIQYDIGIDEATLQENEINSSGTMKNGALSVSLIGTTEERSSLYYDSEYYLRPNEFICGDRTFSHWILSNSKDEWYGIKNNITGWFSKSEFISGNAQFITYENTVVKNGFLTSGDVFENLTARNNDVITAHACWVDKTIVYYNTNAPDANLNSKYKQYSDNYILVRGFMNSDKFNQTFHTDNLNGSLDTTVELKTDDFFGMTRQGYSFDGWNSKTNGSGINYSENSTIKDIRDAGLNEDGDAANNFETSETTLYAQWRLNKYKIHYCGNGADECTYDPDTINGDSGNHECNELHYYDEEEFNCNDYIALKANKFSRTGYTFVGWSTTPSAEDGVIYQDSALVSNLSLTDGDIVWLYAQWVPAQFYYNANLPISDYTINDDYKLNKNDDICNSHGEIIAYNFTAPTVTVADAFEYFGLSVKDYGFVGWSKDRNGTNILQPGEYPIADILAYFGDLDSKLVPLYAIWSQKSVSFSYNVGTDAGISSLKYDIDSDNYIISKSTENHYKDIFYEPNDKTEASVKGLSDFGCYIINSDKRFSGWEARKVNGEETYYFTTEKNWVKVGSEDTPYLFQSNEKIEGDVNNSISFSDLFGDDLYNDGANISFYAVYKENLPYTLNINYKLVPDNSEYRFIFNNNSFSKDENDFIIYDNKEYTETYYLSAADLETKLIYIKSMDSNGFDIVCEYNSFIGWDGSKMGGQCSLTEILGNNNSFSDTNNVINITLVAYWQPNELNIYYNSNEGETSNNNYELDVDSNILNNSDKTKYVETYKANETIKYLPKVDFQLTRIGHVFNGFTIDDISCQPNVEYTAIGLAPELKYGDASVTAYADWKPNEINIIYNVNGGFLDSDRFFVNEAYNHIAVGSSSNDNIFKQVVAYGNNVTVLADDYFGLMHNACKFTGWNTQPDGSGKSFDADVSYAIFDYVEDYSLSSQDIVLYAQWEPDTYNVYYCGNGADGEGYTNYLSGLTENDADYGSIFSKGSYNGNICENISCSSIGNYYHNKEWSYNQSSTLASNLFTRTGYVFAGYWTDEYGNQYSENELVENIPVNENGVAFLYAQWTPISYIVEYDGNGETTGLVSEQELTYNQIDSLNDNSFMKDYYHNDSQKSWIASRVINDVEYYCTAYDSKTFEITWSPKNEINIEEDAYKFSENETIKNLSNIDGDIVTMHAVWNPNELTIVYNANGGEVSSDDYYLSSTGDEYIYADDIKDLYKHLYVYNENTTTIDINSSNTFGLIKEDTVNDVRFVFVGWAFDKTAYVPDFTNKNLSGISIEQLAPELKYDNVRIDFFAIWDEVSEIVLTYYEGEEVSSEKLLSDFKSAVPFPNAHFDVGTASGAPFEYPETINKFKPDAASYGNYDTDGLYTYFDKLVKDEFIKITHPYFPGESSGEKELFFHIAILYNNVPEITACDRWYTLEDALAGKITKQDLLKTAIAEDVESGNISHLLEIINFDNYTFDSVGEYEITYRVTDDIPAKGSNKTSTKTITVHIVNSYENEKVRFISENYYPLMSNLYIDSDGNYKAKKVDGILYFLNTDGELCMDAEHNAFPVDAGLSVKTLLNADGTYTVIPLSKWYKDDENIDALRNCLSNSKDENQNWNRIEETWTFSGEEIKAIKENLMNNIYDENFYTNQFVNGHCVSITNKSAISQTYDLGNDQVKYLNITDSVANGFAEGVNIDGWSELFHGYLVIPSTVENIAAHSFENNDKIIAVNIPSTVNEVGSNAFKNCINLKTVVVNGKEGDVVIYQDSFDENVNIIYIE